MKKEYYFENCSFIGGLIGSLYLSIFLYDKQRVSDKYSVYCDNDIIDTLGHSSEVGKFTRSYSDELTYECGVKVFGIWFICYSI